MGTIEQQLTSIVVRREYHYKTAIANFRSLDKEDRSIEILNELRELRTEWRYSIIELLSYLQNNCPA